jgi:drug/metabolite transporter (DMT)-like permease
MFSKEKNIKKKIRIRELIFLQMIVVIYTLSSVVLKKAADTAFFSLPFIGLYALEIGILGVYAICWQQIIKKVDLSIAYANRAVALLWSMVWAVVFFDERITIPNLIGVMIVIAGTIIVNSDDE